MGHREAELRRPRWVRLANLEGASGCFSGRSIQYRTPCMASEFITCHVARQLSLWNEFLLYAHFELRLLPGSTGQLGLFSTEGDDASLYELNHSRVHQAATLVYWLLRNHHCVISLQAHPDILRTYPDIFARIIRSNTTLKVLKLHVLRTGFLESFRVAIPNLTYLETLHCTSNEDCPAKLLAALSKLLRTTTSLTDLNTSALSIDGHPAEMTFFSALAANSTLRVLTLHYDAAYGPYKHAFEDYIKATTTLTTLTIVATYGSKSQVWLSSILKGLLVNRSITSVTLKSFYLDHIRVEILTKVIARNSVLSTLHFGSLRTSLLCQRRNVGERCVDAILQNESLQELSLPIEIWEPSLWEYLFKALGPQRGLKINIFSYLWETSLTKSVCRLLSGSDAEDKVFLRNYYIDGNSSPGSCEAYSELCRLSRTHGAFERVVLERLPSFSRLKKLSFMISPDFAARASAIADYVGATSTLEAVNISASSRGGFANVSNTWWTKILQSLSQNSSIHELEVFITNMDVGNLERLAEVIKASKNIRWLTVSLEVPENSSAFLQRLSKDISANYTLTRVILHTGIEPSEDWFSVMDTARRNSDLVNRAVLFATASMFDKYCATALETVVQHPALRREFAELAAVGEEAAEEMIRSALRSIQDMDNFMRALGVVRDRVVCHPREDGSMQLDELHSDCWLHVRQYLQLDDVKYPGPFP